MEITQSIKDAINSHSDDIFKAYGVDLKKGKGLCPFHADKTPSFIAKPDNTGRWKWKCLACDKKGGDILSFVAEIEGSNIKSDFVEVVKKAAAICNLSHLLSDDEQGDEQNEQPDREPKKSKQSTTLPTPPHYLNTEMERMSREIEVTNLYAYLCTRWDKYEVLRVMNAYKVGRGYYVNTKTFKMSDKPANIQNTIYCSAFPSIDIGGNCHAIKIIPYPADDHHRIQNYPSGVMTWIKPDQNTGAYFGTHLLPLYPSAPVAIVESEKSAIIGTLFAPEYVWIATQGKGNFDIDSEKCRPSIEALRGRELHVFPDVGGVQDWSSYADKLRAEGFNVKLRDEVISLLPYDENFKPDIADVIVWDVERKLNSEPVAVQSQTTARKDEE